MPEVAFDTTDPWFIDTLDNTTIQFRDVGGKCPDPRVRVRQSFPPNVCDLDDGSNVTVDCGIDGIFFFQNFRPEFDPALPDDFAFESGSFSRFDDRLSLFLEEFTPSRVGEPLELSQENRRLPVETFITRYDFINRESLGTSDGNTNQTFQVSGSEIKVPTKGSSFVFVGGDNGAKWTQIDNLGTAEATSTVFEYDKDIGKVTFGDGINGAIPPAGQEIVLKISVREGGGVWEFKEIVVAPKDGFNVGGVKSIADKVFYVRTKVAGADASITTSVKTTMNVIRQKETFEGTTLRDIRIWSLGLGGNAVADGGIATVRNTGIKETFSREKEKRSESVGEDHEGDASPVGTPRDASTHKILDITGAYPSITGTAPVGGNTQVFSNTDPNWQVVEMTSMEGGLITSPKEYEVDTRVYPIFQVVEIQNFHGLTLTGTGTDCENDILITDENTTPSIIPFYALWFFIWPDIEFFSSNGIEHTGDRKVYDSDNRSQQRAAFSPIVPGRGIQRLIEMADIVGTFNSPIHSGGSSWTDLSEGLNNSDTRTLVGAGAFGRITPFDTTRHPEWIKMKYEVRDLEQDKVIDTHIFGTPFDDFTCEWTVEEGTVTNLPDREFIRNENPPCLSVDNPLDTRIFTASTVPGYTLVRRGFYPAQEPA